MRVIDHNEPAWQAKFDAKPHTNGAATYSRDIVEHHMPVWSEILPDDAVVSTCPLMTGLDVRGSVAVQYLHTYSYSDPFQGMAQVSNHLRRRFDRVVFVTAYRGLHERASLAGYDSVFVPMIVDDRPVRRVAVPESDRLDRGRIVYFGNVTRPKVAEYTALKAAIGRAGWRLDAISKQRFQGRFVDQEECWRIASRYRYGIGVGRCALEMMSLGMRVLVSGANFGGIVTTSAELAVQHGTNFNGRVTTFDRDYTACIDSIDASLDLTEINDMRVALDAIRSTRL